MDNTFVTIAVIAGIGAIGYFLYKQSKSKDSTNANMDSARQASYEAYKYNIQKAIDKKDYETLEGMLKSRRMEDFKDLHEMIKSALKNKPK